MRITEVDEDDDDALFQKTGRGDRAAFCALVARHRRRLMTIAVRVTGDRSAAEDLVQEVFIRAWREAPRFRPLGAGRSGAKAWLSKVAVNLAIDHARRPRGVALETAPEPHDQSVRADEALIAQERDLRLRAAVDALPPRQRAAIALAYDDGLSNAEGAAALGVSLGAFELLLVRARRALRLAFAEGTKGQEGP